MCKSAPVMPQPEPVEIKHPTQADAQATKTSSVERNRTGALAGRDIETSARGLDDNAKTKRKILLGE